MVDKTPDLSGLEIILKDYAGMVARIGSKVASGAAPSVKTAGHFEDEASQAGVEEPTRREAMQFIFGGVAAGALSMATHTAFGQTLAASDRPSSSDPIRGEFLRNLVSREYNDKIFDSRTVWEDPTQDETTLHNSHYFLRKRDYVRLAANLSNLEKALERATNPDTRAFIAQRLIIDNNALGHGTKSALYSGELKKQLIDDVSEDIRKSINSRSIDVICTSTLNTMPRQDFLQFKALNTSDIERRYKGLEINMHESTGAMVRQSLGGLNASVFSVLQSKWMQEMQTVNPYTQDYFGTLSRIRRHWFEEVYAVANGLERHKFAKEIAEDFFYTICRIAFHAYACDDVTHLSEILDVYFVGRPTMKPHVAAARPDVINRSAPNIQWVKMLSVRAVERRGSKFFGEKRYEVVKDDIESSGPANAVVGRALAELGVGFGYPVADLSIDSLLSTRVLIPGVYNQLSYYDIIVHGLLS